MKDDSKECCPVFDPERWDGKTFAWDQKPFIRESIPTFFHIPFPPMIGKKVGKMWSQAEASGKVEADKEEVLLLFTDPHPFKSEIFLSVTGQIPKAANETITGNFAARVFDGPYNAIPKFIREMDADLEAKGQKSKKYYVHYAYCPKCAKKYKHNYMILFARI